MRLGPLHFLHPLWLLALPGLAALAAFTVHRRAGRDGAWARLVDEPLRSLMRVAGAERGRSPWPIIYVAWTGAVLALAGPTWQHRVGAGYRAAAAWVVLLDLSPSMGASDVQPDRVARARYAIEDLLAAAHDARVGLVVFAGEPYTVAPLTSDVATIRALLQPLSPGLMPESGHDLAPALARAGRLLASGHAGHGQVIVLTDGFDDEASALAAAAHLRQQGATVSVVGIGTRSGAPERDAAGAFVRDTSGAIVVSRLEAGRLARLAAAGGGRLVGLAGLPGLIASLDAARSRSFDTGRGRAGARIASWRNDGVWLLPALLLATALLARRGWI